MAASKLCKQCSSFFAGTATLSSTGQRFNVHSDLATFYDATKAKCHLCTILYSRWKLFLDAAGPVAEADGRNLEIQCQANRQWQRLYCRLVAVDASQVKEPVIEAAATFSLIPAAGELASLNLVIPWKRTGLSAVVEVFAVWVQTDQSSGDYQFFNPRCCISLLTQLIDLDQAASEYVATPTTLSEHSISIAKEWYRNCSEEHEYCVNGSPPLSYFPRRAIDVLSPDEKTVKLVLNDNGLIFAPYMTLSHCWGKLSILKLDSHSLGDFQTGVDIQRLAKTFQDAIRVTRQLGFRYLWIDSLCIIQDSKEDWLHESAVMGKIYQHGELNIAATMASSGAEGLDYARQPICSEQLKISATWPLSEVAGSNDFPPAGDYYLVDSDLWMWGIDRAPLNTRGWVLQERTMAPRILHFGRNQLFWQCGLDQSCEMYPRNYGKHRLGVGTSAYTERDLRPFVQVLEQVKQNPRSLDDWLAVKEVYAPWKTLVEMYSAMNLTKGEDKLVAIQAVAQAMQEVLPNDRYIAGFWESRLVEDMLWRVRPGILDRPSIKRSKEWRAPTWSWAAIDGPVTKAALSGRYAGHKEFDGTVLVEDLRADVDALGADTGPLRSASLKLRGNTWWFRQPLKLRPVIQEQTGVASHLFVKFGKQDGGTLNCWPDELDWDLEAGFEMLMPGNTALLAVGTYDVTLDGKTSTTFEGILLQDSRDGNFLRVGYFSLTCSTFASLQESLSCARNSQETIDLDLPKTELVLL